MPTNYMTKDELIFAVVLAIIGGLLIISCQRKEVEIEYIRGGYEYNSKTWEWEKPKTKSW